MGGGGKHPRQRGDQDPDRRLARPCRKLDRLVAQPARGGHPGGVLQFHAGAGLDAHRPDLAAARWRAVHALRPARFRGLRYPYPATPERGRGLPRSPAGRGRPPLRRHGRCQEAGTGREHRLWPPRRRRTADHGGRACAAGQLRPGDGRGAAPELPRLSGTGRPGRAGSGDAALLPSRRPALSAAGPAPHHVDRGGLRRAYGRRRSARKRDHALFRLAWGAARQRPAGDDAPLWRPRAFPAPAQCPPRHRNRPRQLLRGRPPWRPDRHGRADRRRSGRGRPPPRRGARGCGHSHAPRSRAGHP
jgi:hypothetical protein